MYVCFANYQRNLMYALCVAKSVTKHLHLETCNGNLKDFTKANTVMICLKLYSPLKP